MTSTEKAASAPSDNEVFLRGRLAAPPEERTLPSGDPVTIFRITVDRNDPDSKVRVDSIDCAVFAARPRRSVARAAPGDLLEARGSLRRRFFRAGASVGSRYEVVISGIRVLRRPRSGA